MLYEVGAVDRLTFRVLKFSMTAVATAIGVYYLLATAGVITTSGPLPTILSSCLWALSIAWLTLGVLTLLSSHRSSKSLLVLQISFYHLLGGLHMMISSNPSDMQLYWLLLLMYGFILFGKKAAIYGSVSYVVITYIDSLVRILSLQLADAAGSSIVVSSTILSIFTTISIMILFSIVYSSKDISIKHAISSRDQLSVDRDRMMTLINSLSDAIFSVDRQGRVTMYNSASLNLIDTNDSITGKPISDLLQLSELDNTPVDITSELQQAKSTRYRDDLVMNIDGNDQLRLGVTIAGVQSGGRDESGGSILIIKDITKTKNLEEERDEFISVISHELRTPITVTEGALSNAMLYSKKGLAEKADQSIDAAHRQVEYLARLVNDLGTLSRANNNLEDETEMVDITQLSNQLISDYSRQASDKKLKLILEINSPQPIVTNTHPLYLRELLQNLITNAIKYTQQGSVTLKVTSTGQKVQFSVIDTGIGIGKSDRQKVFDRFYRSEDYRTRTSNGTGIGLHVSAKLAKLLGSQIKLTSRLNHGSTFSFAIDQRTS